MNRIVQNVIIVDSAMGNNFILTSAGQAINVQRFSINAIAFYTVDSNSSIVITGANTANDLLFSSAQGSAAATPNPKWFNFGSPQRFENLKVPILTQGTAFIYLV